MENYYCFNFTLFYLVLEVKFGTLMVRTKKELEKTRVLKSLSLDFHRYFIDKTV